MSGWEITCGVISADPNAPTAAELGAGTVLTTGTPSPTIFTYSPVCEHPNTSQRYVVMRLGDLTFGSDETVTICLDCHEVTDGYPKLRPMKIKDGR